MKRNLVVVAPEGHPVTTQTINDHMNQHHARIKKANPLGFMDQYDQQLEIICSDIAAELGGEFMLRDGTDSEGKPVDELLFHNAQIDF